VESDRRHLYVDIVHGRRAGKWVLLPVQGSGEQRQRGWAQLPNGLGNSLRCQPHCFAESDHIAESYGFAESDRFAESKPQPDDLSKPETHADSDTEADDQPGY
jgi:hypothetical protein